jgi:hypothetical protein
VTWALDSEDFGKAVSLKLVRQRQFLIITDVFHLVLAFGFHVLFDSLVIGEDLATEFDVEIT